MIRQSVFFLVCLLLLQWTCCSSDFFGAGYGFRFPGHHPGHHQPHQHAQRQEDVDYYKILGVERSSSEKEIKTAYRKKAMKMHPDKGGDANEFKALVEAYEVLSDKEKKAIYDTMGKQGLRGQFNAAGAGANGFADLFRSFHMPVVYNLELALEDFFHGRSITLMLNQERFVVEIAPGMMEGMEIRGRLSQSTSRTPRRERDREVIFVLQEKKHPIFQRKNADLYTEISITLTEALLGFEKPLRLLDGQIVLLAPALPGQTVNPGDVLIFDQLGMPVYSTDYLASPARGRLFVKVMVQLPRQLSLNVEDRATLLRLLDHSGSSGSSSRPTRLESDSISPSKEELLQTPRPAGRKVMGGRGDLRSFGAVGAVQEEEDESFPFGSFFFR